MADDLVNRAGTGIAPRTSDGVETVIQMLHAAPPRHSLRNGIARGLVAIPAADQGLVFFVVHDEHKLVRTTRIGHTEVAWIRVAQGSSSRRHFDHCRIGAGNLETGMQSRCVHAIVARHCARTVLRASDFVKTVTRPPSALGELEALACLGLAVFLALHHAAVAGQETRGLECRAIPGIIELKRL